MIDLTEKELEVLKMYYKADTDIDYFELNFRDEIVKIDNDNRFVKSLIQKGYINATIRRGIQGAEEIILKREKFTTKALNLLKEF